MTDSASTELRVLLGIPDPSSLGGPAACEPPFVAELKRQGVEVEEEIYVYGDKLSSTSGLQRIRRVLHSAARLRRKFKRGRFDLIHLNSSFDRRAIFRDIATISLLGSKPKIFIKFHGSDAALLQTNDPSMKILVKRLLSRVDGIGLLSEEEKANFIAAGWPPEKIYVVKNVVERTFPPRSADFKQRFGWPVNMPVLLFIGRFIPAKGLADTVKALGLLHDKELNCALICVGDGPDRDAAQTLVRDLHLTERVRFTGLVAESDTGEFYSNCDALVFPTYHYEGFPMTIFYALAAGLPIVTTRIRAAADYLTEPENCLWTEPRNPAMLAEQIEFLINNRKLQNSMSEANRALAANFDATTVTREYIDVYESILSRPKLPDKALNNAGIEK